MNALQLYISRQKLNEVRAMNYLQQQLACVSDNAVLAGDVADVDCQQAVNALLRADEGDLV